MEGKVSTMRAGERSVRAHLDDRGAEKLMMAADVIICSQLKGGDENSMRFLRVRCRTKESRCLLGVRCLVLA